MINWIMNRYDRGAMMGVVMMTYSGLICISNFKERKENLFDNNWR